LLPPEEWRPGKIYVDEAEVTLPDPVWSDEVQLTVGFEKQWDYPLRPETGAGGAGAEEESDTGVAVGDEGGVETTQRPMRLRVVSGPSDGKGRGIVARRPTNFDPKVAKQKMAARRAAENEARSHKMRHGGRRMPPRARPDRRGSRSPHGPHGKPSLHGARRDPSSRGPLSPDGQRRRVPGMAPRGPGDPNARPQPPRPVAPPPAPRPVAPPPAPRPAAPAPAPRPTATAPAPRPVAPAAPRPPPPAPPAPPAPQP